MPIESLYLLPIIALAVFFYIIAYFVQKENDKKKAHTLVSIVEDVEAFNQGKYQSKSSLDRVALVERLNEVEAGVSKITEALNHQQKAFEKIHSGSIDYAGEIQKLQQKLQKLSKDYMAVISENKELRARVVKLMDNINKNGIRIIKNFNIQEIDPGWPTYTSNATVNKKTEDTNKKLYDDTHVYKMPKTTFNTNLDDTTEIDLSSL